jgi:hypothetical protein
MIGLRLDSSEKNPECLTQSRKARKENQQNQSVRLCVFASLREECPFCDSIKALPAV